MKRILASIAAIVFAAPMVTSLAAEEVPDVELWRIDCGIIEISDAASFSDAHLYDGEPRTLTNSCYLVRNGERYMLWDAGFPVALKGQRFTDSVFTIGIDLTIEDQLADLDLATEDIDLIALSHYHSDHVGQIPEFANSTLVMSETDWQAVSKQGQEGAFLDRAPFATWLGTDAGEVIAFTGDHDVFGDGSVLIKAMPGHTPGHSALLVRLPDTGDVLLTGDLYHFEEQIENRGLPQFNSNRADTLASFERFNAIAKSLDATVVIQHDPKHIDRLPIFPESAK